MFREYTYWKSHQPEGSLFARWYCSPVPAELNLKATDPGFIHPYLKESQDLTSKATDDLKLRLSQQPEQTTSDVDSYPKHRTRLIELKAGFPSLYYEKSHSSTYLFSLVP